MTDCHASVQKRTYILIIDAEAECRRRCGVAVIKNVQKKRRLQWSQMKPMDIRYQILRLLDLLKLQK